MNAVGSGSLVGLSDQVGPPSASAMKRKKKQTKSNELSQDLFKLFSFLFSILQPRAAKVVELFRAESKARSTSSLTWCQNNVTSGLFCFVDENVWINHGLARVSQPMGLVTRMCYLQAPNGRSESTRSWQQPASTVSLVKYLWTMTPLSSFACGQAPWTGAMKRRWRFELSLDRRSTRSEYHSWCNQLKCVAWRRDEGRQRRAVETLLMFKWRKGHIVVILTALDFYIAQLPIHRKILQVHRTRRRDGQPEKQRSKKKPTLSLDWWQTHCCFI